jgi:hypothetical protein
MRKNKIVERAITAEDKVIGNLKQQFVRSTLHAQRQISVSPATANGNIALAYYRGINVGREDERKLVISQLRQRFPAAAAFLLKSKMK